MTKKVKFQKETRDEALYFNDQDFNDDEECVDALSHKKHNKLKLRATNESDEEDAAEASKQNDSDSNDDETAHYKVEDVKEAEEDTQAEIGMEPFNMKNDLEQGAFNAQGDFVPDATHEEDDWLKDVHQKDIDAAAKAAKQRQEQEAQDMDEDVPNENDLWLRVLNMMKPTELVLDTLRRYGKDTRKRSWQTKQEKKKKAATPATPVRRYTLLFIGRHQGQ